MPVLRTHLDPSSQTALADREAVLAALGRIRELHQKVLAGGGEKYVERHRPGASCSARERVELLLDEDSPFLELAALAGTHDPAETVGGVTGIGTVSGVECMIGANDPTVKGGAVEPDGGRQAAADAGDRRAQPAAADLADRVRRRRSAAAGGHLRARRAPRSGI